MVRVSGQTTQSHGCCLSHCSNAVKRYHGQGNSQKENIVEGLLIVVGFSPLSLWQRSDRDATEALAESFMN